MLHTKFQGHQSIGSGEEDFFKVFNIYGHGGHVGHVTHVICINFIPILQQAFILALVPNCPTVAVKNKF